MTKHQIIPVLALLYFASAALPAQPQFLTRSQARSVWFAESSLKEGEIKFTLQNNSTKWIIGFQVFADPLAITQLFLRPQSTGFPPGEAIDRSFKAPLVGNDKNPEPPRILDPLILELTAVVFEDGSSEGYPKIVRVIESSLRARAVQMARTIPVLQKATAFQGKITSSVLREYADQVAKLPETDIGTANTADASFLGAVRAVKEGTAMELVELSSQLDQLDDSQVRARLRSLESQQQRILTHLRNRQSRER